MSPDHADEDERIAALIDRHWRPPPSVASGVIERVMAARRLRRRERGIGCVALAASVVFFVLHLRATDPPEPEAKWLAGTSLLAPTAYGGEFYGLKRVFLVEGGR
ncbi:MAG: hypothetical protein AAGA56_07740 [Myxococcota bacterium]